jgi:hypothetical protein
MGLLSRVYFNAVFGGLGGLIGWMLFGVFGDSLAWVASQFGDPSKADHIHALLGGAIIGGSIGYFVVGVEALRDQALVRFCRLATYGVILGALGGALGMWLGDQVNYRLVEQYGARRFLVALLARGVGWMVLGLAVGFSEGIAARSLGKLSYGTIGGALGGFVGGVLFVLLYMWAVAQAPTGLLARFVATDSWAALAGAAGLVILGACIGALSALVQAVFQPACVRVLRGWQEGREYPLDRTESQLGRDEAADVLLLRDMKVEKRHALIRREEDRFVLVNHAPPAQTQVNGTPVIEEQVLEDGDRIQLGNVVLRFQLKAARVKQRRALQLANLPSLPAR